MVILCASWLNMFWNQLVYISMISFFSRIGQFALLPSKEEEKQQIDPFEEKKIGKEDITDMPGGYANQLAVIQSQLDSRRE